MSVGRDSSATTHSLPLGKPLTGGGGGVGGGDTLPTVSVATRERLVSEYVGEYVDEHVNDIADGYAIDIVCDSLA